MNEASENLAFWNRVLSAAESIEDQSGENGINECQAQLNTILEAFGELCDPVENFEPYAVMRLIRAINRNLEKND